MKKLISSKALNFTTIFRVPETIILCSWHSTETTLNSVSNFSFCYFVLNYNLLVFQLHRLTLRRVKKWKFTEISVIPGWPIKHLSSHYCGRADVIPRATPMADWFLAVNTWPLKFLLVTVQAQLALLISCFYYGKTLWHSLHRGLSHSDRNFACRCCSISLKMPMASSHKSKISLVYYVPLSTQNVLMGFVFGNDNWILASRQGRLWFGFMYLQFSTKFWI